MLNTHPQYITDTKGRKISVIIPVKEYNYIIEELEELEDIRLYDKAKASKEASVPMDKAFKIIEANRKKK
jgi:hypothetical protein